MIVSLIAGTNHDLMFATSKEVSKSISVIVVCVLSSFIFTSPLIAYGLPP